jgi:metal transporter CNNM
MDSSVLVEIAEAPEGETLPVGSLGAQSDSMDFESRPQRAIFMKRRSSAGPDGLIDGPPVPIKASLEEMKRQLRLGPANRAAKPRSTRPNLFKIKQGLGVTRPSISESDIMPQRSSFSEGVPVAVDSTDGTERTPLLSRASDSVATLEHLNGKKSKKNGDEGGR